MSVSNLNEFPLHEISMNMSSIRFHLLILGLIKFVLVQILLHRKRISLFFASDNSNKNTEVAEARDAEINNDDEEESVCRGEQVEAVMARLGILGEGKLPAKVGAEEMFEMFEERGPSLGEVREAFDVFDRNGDGFIDAEELQRVLCGLGMEEGREIGDCRRMIGAVEGGGDGRIGFEQFVKFMENNFV